MTDVNLVLIAGAAFALYLFLANEGRVAPLAVAAFFATFITEKTWFLYVSGTVRALHWIIVLLLLVVGQLMFWLQNPERRSPAKIWLSRGTHLLALILAYTFPLFIVGGEWTVMIFLGLAALTVVGIVVALVMRRRGSNPPPDPRIYRPHPVPGFPAGGVDDTQMTRRPATGARHQR